MRTIKSFASHLGDLQPETLSIPGGRGPHCAQGLPPAPPPRVRRFQEPTEIFWALFGPRTVAKFKTPSENNTPLGQRSKNPRIRPTPKKKTGEIYKNPDFRRKRDKSCDKHKISIYGARSAEGKLWCLETRKMMIFGGQGWSKKLNLII